MMSHDVIPLVADIKVGDSVAVFGDVEGKCCKGRCERFDGEKIFVGNGQFVMERLDVFKRDPSTIRYVGCDGRGVGRCFELNIL